jgi:hypothetical protein
MAFRCSTSREGCRARPDARGGALGKGRLQRAHVFAEAGFELHRCIAGVAQRTLRFLEGQRNVLATLLKVFATLGGLAFGICRDLAQLFAGARGDVGEVALAPRESLDALDQLAALAVCLFQQAREDESEVAGAIRVELLCERADRLLALLG